MAMHPMHPMHPMLAVLTEAAHGRFPEPDGGVTLLPELDGGLSAVLAFTAHSYVATRLGVGDLDGVRLDGYGGTLAPQTLLRLAQGGDVGEVDVTLVAVGLGGGRLPRTDAWDEHPRVRFARSRRRSVVVHGDDRGFVTLAAGLAGRREMSVEIRPDLHGTGVGRSLLGEARHLVPDGDLLFAAVSPGNARSLRAFLAAGFVPLASEVVLVPGRP